MSPRTDEIFIEDKRQQRAGLFLKNVKYRLHAELHFINIKERKACQIPVSKALISSEEYEDLLKNENPGKYNGMFERRARKGQCFNQPYFGCREFSCKFRFIENFDEEESPIEETRDLGFMLYDLNFSDVMNPLPAFFRPVMNNGVIEVPSWDSKEVFW
jgi:CRISPR-associated protein Cas5d